jgi:hydrogenase-1 operon protein HyaE
MTTAVTGTADPRPAHPLLAQLLTRHGFTEITAANIDAYIEQPGHAMLVFTEDPVRVRETLDIAVIVPELVRAFPGRFRVGVLMPESARPLQARYGFRRWPALVVLSDGKHVGAIEGLRDWDEFLKELARLLETAPKRPPTIGISVIASGANADGCRSPATKSIG